MKILYFCGAYLCFTTVLFQVAYTFQATSFVDEIFHIPQAQKYCDGLFFEWDNKITTLPGLYLATVSILLPLKQLFSAVTCSVWSLRFMNVLFNLGNLLLSYNIFLKLSTKKDSKEVSRISALVVALFPVLYFFSFLYYTDPGSVLFVLATYLASLHNRDSTAALLGAASIVFRQTNIVWVAFVAGVKACDFMGKNASEISRIQIAPKVKVRVLRFLADLMSATLSYLLVLDNIRKIVTLLLPYAYVATGFLFFVTLNGGIVVGDKSSHQAVLHVLQIFYGSLFLLFFSAPLLVTTDRLQRFWRFVCDEKLLAFLFHFIAVYLLTHHAYAHPYLLADNRHLAFYLWRRLLGHPLLRFALVPFYLYAMWSVNDTLAAAGRSALWRSVFLVCAAAVTVPQQLLELRYFILPYVIFRLNVADAVSRRQLAAELLLHAAVNAATFALFVGRTVHWEDLPEPQRIIW